MKHLQVTSDTALALAASQEEDLLSNSVWMPGEHQVLEECALRKGAKISHYCQYTIHLCLSKL